MKIGLVYLILSFLFFLRTSFWVQAPLFIDVWFIILFYGVIIIFSWIFTWSNLFIFKSVLLFDWFTGNLHHISHWNSYWFLTVIFDVTMLINAFCSNIHRFFHLVRTCVNLSIDFTNLIIHRLFIISQVFFGLTQVQVLVYGYFSSLNHCFIVKQTRLTRVRLFILC